MNREGLIRQLQDYRTRWPGESGTVDRFIDFVATHADCFERQLAVGHITGSAWVVNRAGTALTSAWNPGHMAIIRAAARDPRVERIFVDPVVKVAMCEMEGGNRAWLRKVRPLNNHDYHFHVRLGCPAGSACQQQDPPPAGDGCDEAAEWIKNRIDPSRVKPVPPDPDYRHPRSFRLSEMPRQCQAVATAR